MVWIVIIKEIFLEDSSKYKKKYNHLCQLNNAVDVNIVDIYVNGQNNIFILMGIIFIYINNESEI